MKTTILLLASVTGLFAAERPAKPNVLFILADDLGWQDVKCYDVDEPTPMETPHIDALAKRGVQFWQAYSPAPTCAPSRCAIMSGIHPARSQKTHVVGGEPPMLSTLPMVEPWYSGRIMENTPSLAQLLKDNGYATGHTGKWHMAIGHHDTPKPHSLGFDFTTHMQGADVRGIQRRMPDRLDFSTKDSEYPLDENDFPIDPITEESLRFMRENKDKPFFLYNATWLVHTPVQSRSKPLLTKYCDKLGVPFPTNTKVKYTKEGQVNPFYCAMVETLDYYTGKLIAFLDETDDPRWPGHKLSENTYIIFTSDNGGAEGSPLKSKGVITDNYPLDRGKSASKEGGIRVPFLIAGPNIKSNVQSNTLVNGLDLYPTILSWTNTSRKENQIIDGGDLSTLLVENANQDDLVLDSSGDPRETMFWHFPHPGHSTSAIRNKNFKLIVNYGAEYEAKINDHELYHLYDGSNQRVDIEEKKDVAVGFPEMTSNLNKILQQQLDEMKATKPYHNPISKEANKNKSLVPTKLSHEVQGNTLTIRYKENGAKVSQCFLYFTTPAEEESGEWFRKEVTIDDDEDELLIIVPERASHAYVSLIDENQFITMYPQLNKKRRKELKHGSLKF